ncbi:MAG TPA: hypothetical protein VNW72_07720 [Chthoniobacterales bacterium]|jgi:hypothetical protein|nr:hypothetical protein [Chthoniobacterales bacterium]
MTDIPPLCVVDVNVGIAANGQADVCAECEFECVETLQSIMERGRVAIDNLDLIWNEYMGYFAIAGEPGMGDQFLRWIHENQWTGDRCERVPITLAATGDFEEFPKDPSLGAFDKSDRKYVAVAVAALACLGPTSVLNATDSDWKHHEDTLNSIGIPVLQLCPDELKE